MNSLQGTKTWRFLLVLSLALLLAVPIGFAQSTTATINVVASDSTGAAVAGANVTVRNTDTNATRSGTTDGEGRAFFHALPVGPYEVTIDKSGFGKAVRTGIVLVLNQVAVVSTQLKPAAVTETVTVTEDAPLLNTVTNEVGVRFDDRRLSQLPTQGNPGNSGGGFRDVFSFGLSAPGVSQINIGNTGFANGTDYAVNGARVRSNNFTLDGQDVNDPSVAGYQQAFNNPDAVQEFRMITNQFSAENGRSSGSVVNVITKSGTNAFHGSAFWYHNSNPLNSRNNLDKNTAAALAGNHKQPLRIENQIGGTLGGPIVKDRMFFFGSLQRWTDRQLGSGSEISGAPTAAGKAALQANGGTRPQVAALLNFLPAAATATGNVIYCFNGAAPVAGACSSGTLVTVPVGKIVGANRIKFDNWQWSGRIDHRFNDNHSLNGRYMFSDSLSEGQGQATPAGLANVSPTRSQAMTLGLTSSLTPSLINEARLSWNRLATATNPQDPSSLTIPSIEINELGMTGFNAVGTRTAIGYGVNLPQSRRNNIYQLQENMTWVKGSHTWKFGADIRYQDLASDFNPNVRGQVRYTTLHNLVADVTANAQLSAPLPGGQLVVYYSWWDYFFYVQDTWKVSPTFTLNYGLRYELPGNAVENLFRLNDRILAANGNNALFRYNSRPDRDMNNIQPRIGFNWNPQTSSDGLMGLLTGGNKTVIRGGYSRTNDYAFLNMALNISSAFPFQAAYSFPAAGGYASVTGTPTLSLGTPGTACTAPGASATAPCLNQTVVADDFRAPSADQFSLEIQREIGAHNVFKIGYVGTRGNALYQSIEGNPTTVCTQNGSGGSGGVFATLTPSVCPRVDPTRGVVRVRANTGESIYHSLQTSFDHRFSKGLTAGVHYTWSSFIDDGSEVFNPSSSEVATPQNPLLPKHGERARSTYDRPHRVTGNLVYELPWHKNQAGAAGRILGGWQVGTVMTFQSGSPFTVLNGSDPAGVLSGSLVGLAIRPNMNTNLNLSGMTLAEVIAAGGRTLFHQILVDCPAGTCVSVAANSLNPLKGRTGNAPRNLLRADGLVSIDANISKHIKIVEGHSLSFRADFFNMPNTRNFGIPNANANATAAAFLNEKATDGGNRRIFMSLSYKF